MTRERRMQRVFSGHAPRQTRRPVLAELIPGARFVIVNGIHPGMTIEVYAVTPGNVRFRYVRTRGGGRADSDGIHRARLDWFISHTEVIA